jgi:hypothetical protein
MCESWLKHALDREGPGPSAEEGPVAAEERSCAASVLQSGAGASHHDPKEMFCKVACVCSSSAYL